eukprot:10089464-Alexandrium_andersonii.AAC.1
MKAQGIQRRTALGACESGSNDRHSQAGPSHGAVLGVREAQSGFGRHCCEEDSRARSGEVGPEAALGLGHVVDRPRQALLVDGL